MKASNMISRTAMLGAACMLALGASAHAQNGEWMNNNNQPNNWSRRSYVDFATTTIAGHAGIPTGTFGGVAGLKYKFLQLDLGSVLNNSQCFELRTSAPTFLPGVTADTRFWIVSHLGSQANPVSLNDDFGGTVFSAARVWLQGAPSSFINLDVAAFSAGWNTMHFNLIVTQLPLSEASCTTAQPAPAMAWVKVKNGTMTKSP